MDKIKETLLDKDGIPYATLDPEVKEKPKKLKEMQMNPMDLYLKAIESDVGVLTKTEEIVAAVSESKLDESASEYETLKKSASDASDNAWNASKKVSDAKTKTRQLHLNAAEAHKAARDAHDKLHDYRLTNKIDTHLENKHGHEHNEMVYSHRYSAQLKEEVELTELSKSTLTSYADKAEKDADKHSKASVAAWEKGDKEADDKHFSKMSKRSFGAGMAKYKASLKNEEVDQDDEEAERKEKMRRAMNAVADSAKGMPGLGVKGGTYRNKYATQKSDVKKEHFTFNDLLAKLDEAKQCAEVEKEEKSSKKASIKFHDGDEDGTRVTEEVELDEMAMDAIKHPVHGKIEWRNEGGAHMITTNNGKTIHAIGDHKEIADKWAKVKSKLVKEDAQWDELNEAAFAPTMKKAIAAHERGDHKMTKYHLDNAKTARYAMKSTDITKHKDLLDKYKELRDIHEELELDEVSQELELDEALHPDIIHSAKNLKKHADYVKSLKTSIDSTNKEKAEWVKRGYATHELDSDLEGLHSQLKTAVTKHRAAKTKHEALKKEIMGESLELDETMLRGTEGAYKAGHVPKGKVHKGSYGSEYDTDETGSEIKKATPEVKRGRGRPKKGADETGEVKKYNFHDLLNRLSR